MGLITRVKNAWNGFMGGSDQGWVPMDTGYMPQHKGGEEQWLTQSAYFACLRNIAEDIGKLPAILYRRLERGKERARDHRYYQLIRRRPHRSINAGAFTETLTRYALGWGNGYARIHRSFDGGVYSMEPVHPQYVTPMDDGLGGVSYRIKFPGVEEQIIPQQDMLHIHGVGSNGITGMSVAQYARETLEFGKGAQTFGKNLYTRNGRPAGYLKSDAKMSPEQRKANAAAWRDAHSGDKMGGTAMLDNGLDYKQITINPTDAQYLETRQFSVEEIARWFRMPLHKIQHMLRAQGWSTLDATNTDYLTDTLLPWLTRWEDELTYKLFETDTEYFVEYLVDSILRADMQTRGDYNVKMFSIGKYSINEIRALDNENPIPEPGGDTHFVPLNMTPAQFADSINGNKSSSSKDSDITPEILSGGIVPVGYYDNRSKNGNGNGNKNRIIIGS